MIPPLDGSNVENLELWEEYTRVILLCTYLPCKGVYLTVNVLLLRFEKPMKKQKLLGLWNVENGVPFLQGQVYYQCGDVKRCCMYVSGRVRVRACASVCGAMLRRVVCRVCERRRKREIKITVQLVFRMAKQPHTNQQPNVTRVRKWWLFFTIVLATKHKTREWVTVEFWRHHWRPISWWLDTVSYSLVNYCNVLPFNFMGWRWKFGVPAFSNKHKAILRRVHFWCLPISGVGQVCVSRFLPASSWFWDIWKQCKIHWSHKN